MHAVPGLLKAFHARDRLIRRRVVTALIRLLPRMAPADALLLTDEHRETLYELIEGSMTWGADRDWLGAPLPASAGCWWGRSDLVKAVLTALERMEDPQAISHVSVVASGRGNCGWKREAREAAVRCAAALRENAGEGRASRELLRAPRSGDATEAETLLRPPCATDGCDPADLPRPMQAPADGRR